MKSVHVISSVDEEAAGPAYTVPRLARSLIALGESAEVATLGQPGVRLEAGLPITRHAPDAVWPSSLARLGRSRSMRLALLNSDAQVLHGHGLWMMPNVYPGLAANRLRRPFVLAPRGMLGKDSLRFSAYKKKFFWAVWQARAVASVQCFHATAESEYEDIRAYGLRQPVAVIPNGVDLPLFAGSEARHEASAPRFVLSLGRIHPKKGLDRLIAAFARVAQDHPEWQLRIVGPDEGGHAEALRKQAKTCGLSDRVSIEGTVYGEAKFRLMSQASVFALATLHENFGMTVAESLSVGTPVISTRGAPWGGLSEHGCGWWVEHGPEPMAAALKYAMEMPHDVRRAMGAKGRDWMARDFAWNGIAGKMVMVYRWLHGGSAKPDWVWT